MANGLIELAEFLDNISSLKFTNILAETESHDYGAYTFNIGEISIVYRVAKITPTKIGQFVTLWKRSEKGPIRPFDLSDKADLFIISTRTNKHFGIFIFPKSVLYEKKVISDDNKEGKRAIRVYPPWDRTINKQAQKTQQWQLKYFLEIGKDKIVDLARVKQLFNLY